MRVRIRKNVLDTHSAPNIAYTSRYYKCDGTMTSSTPSVSAWQHENRVLESMTDEVGRGGPHSCLHRRMTWKANYYVGPYLNGVPVAPYGYTDDLHLETRWLKSYHDLIGVSCNGGWNETNISDRNTGVPYWSFSPPVINESSLIEDCFEQAHQLKADVLLNIVEANQIWPSLRSLSTCIGEIAYNWGRIRKVIKTASGAYLAWKFGVSPILSDIMAIDRYLPKLKQDMTRHVNGQSNRSSKKITLVAQYTKAADVGTATNGQPHYRFDYKGRVLQEPTIRYVLVTKPRIRYQTSVFKALDFAMQRFSSSPASLAWERIPFSFIADWFVDIRGALRKIDAAVGFSPYEIVSFTRSYSYEVASEAFIKTHNCCNGAVLHANYCGSATFRHYERSLVSVGATAPTWKPRFGKNQAGILAALISQKLSKL